MSFTGLLNNTFNLIGAGMSVDAYGGWSSSPTTVSAMSALPCRYYQLSAEERNILNREGVSPTHKMYCNYYSVITEEHLVEINGSQHEITQINDPSYMHHHLEIMLVI